jgi:diguanylate cyclase (GGDEF)-like protein
MSQPPLAAARSGGEPPLEAAPDAPRVLVIEDERIVAADLRQILRGLGYDAYAAAPTAAKALAMAAQAPPDVVLADIRIEGPVDGIDAAQQLHQEYGAAVVFLTAHADDPTVERAKRAHPSGYLVKPISALAVKAAIEIALDRRLREKSIGALEQTLIEVSAQLMRALNHLPLAVQLEDATNRIVHTNPAFRALFGIEEQGADLVGLDGALVMEHAGALCAEPERFTARLGTLRQARAPASGDLIRLKDGRTLEMDFIPILRANAPDGQLWIFRDVRLGERPEERPGQGADQRQEGLVDSLTRLVGRNGFLQLAPTYLKLMPNVPEREQVLLLAQVEGLREIGERHGTAAADRAIRSLAEALRRSFRLSDLIARVGETEFAVLAAMSSVELAGVASRLNTRLEAISCEGSALLAVSVGVVDRRPGESLDELMLRAEVSLNGSKRPQSREFPTES